MASKRTIYLPSAAFAAKTLPVTRLKARKWLRLHTHPYGAVDYSAHINRFSGPDHPRKILYLAQDHETCLMELFGNRIYGARSRDLPVALSQALWQAKRCSQIRLPSLNVCDLTQPRTLTQCAVDLASLTNADLSIPQAWGKALMLHPQQFDGLLYQSRFTTKPCLALFEPRPGTEVQLTVSTPLALNQLEAAYDLLTRFKVALV